MEFHLTQEILDKIDQYIKGELEGDQLLAFEQELESSEALQEETMIQQQLFNSIGNNSLGVHIINDVGDKEIQEKIKSPEYQSLSNKIRTIGEDYIQNPTPTKKSSRTRFRQLIPAIAAIFLLVVVSTVYLVNGSRSIDQYYYDNVNWNTELVSFAEKGDSKSAFVKAEIFFEAKEYTKTIQALEEINEEDTLYPYGLMYIGASYANLDQNQQALQVFNALGQMKEFNESSKGLWYAALIHLKRKDKEKAMEVLNIIVKDEGNYDYKDAQEILKELEK